jgi:LysM repeat protein
VDANADISPEARKVLQSILQQSRGTSLTPQEGLPAATGIEDSGELTVYTCKSGDNIASVSRKHNVTEEQLMKWNILKPGDVLKPGMELYVYINR